MHVYKKDYSIFCFCFHRKNLLVRTIFFQLLLRFSFDFVLDATKSKICKAQGSISKHFV